MDFASFGRACEVVDAIDRRNKVDSVVAQFVAAQGTQEGIEKLTKTLLPNEPDENSNDAFKKKFAKSVKKGS